MRQVRSIEQDSVFHIMYMYIQYYVLGYSHASVHLFTLCGASGTKQNASPVHVFMRTNVCTYYT